MWLLAIQGENPGTMPRINQVDAVMSSLSPSCLPHATGAAVVLADGRVRTTLTHHLVAADTLVAAGALFGSGLTVTSARRNRHGPEARGRSAHSRANPRIAPSGPDPLWRARRIYNDYAHANRCAPPGRNPGGGAQGQSD